jgi:uncharacterized membrane protein YkvA (DUF1232 family)
MKDSVAVGYVDNIFIFAYLGNEVSRVKVIADWHTKAKD